jgi:ribosomal protein L32
MKSLLGWFGERKTGFHLWLGLDSETYFRYPDVILESKTGTVQIDHIVISPYGVFIVETKNLSGWIFGSEHQPVWTQSLYGRNYTFQNPLRQAYRQKVILSSFLDVDAARIHPVIVFVGNGSFKTDMPPNVIRNGLASYINEFDEVVFREREFNRMVRRMDDHVETSTLTMDDHLHSLHRRHHSSTVCPTCGAKLVERTSRKGPNAGTPFLGCEKFPACRYSRGL